MSNSLIPAGQNLPSSIASTSNIDFLKLTYGSSRQAADGSANVGDWYDNESLGKIIKLTALAYRVIATVFIDNEFIDKVTLADNGVDIIDRPEYKDLVKKHGLKNVSHGVDILVYLPEFNTFRTLTCTSWGMKKVSAWILENGANGSVLQLKANLSMKNGKVQTAFEKNITGETTDVPEVEKWINIYNAQIDAIKDDSDDSDDREV